MSESGIESFPGSNAPRAPGLQSQPLKTTHLSQVLAQQRHSASGATCKDANEQAQHSVGTGNKGFVERNLQNQPGLLKTVTAWSYLITQSLALEKGAHFFTLLSPKSGYIIPSTACHKLPVRWWLHRDDVEREGQHLPQEPLCEALATPGVSAAEQPRKNHHFPTTGQAVRLQ